MDSQMIALVVAGGGVLGVVVWVLAKVGKALIKIAEVLAAAALVIFAVWLVIKVVVWALCQVVTHWRTSLTVLAMVAWWHWWGGASLVRPETARLAARLRPEHHTRRHAHDGDDCWPGPTPSPRSLLKPGGSPRGDSVHVSVTGLLPGGASVRIYGACGLPTAVWALT
jgi:hypothetical protein